jgi:phenylacetic acid degradation operon negative regulatory protein
MKSSQVATDDHVEDEDSRNARGGSARSLILAMLGEFTGPSDPPVRTSDLLHVLRGLGLDDQAARQAILRCVRADLIVSKRHGREAHLSLSSAGRSLAEQIQTKMRPSPPRAPWDGNWTILSVTISRKDRASRRPFYAALQCAGFGSPVPGLWVSARSEHIRRARRITEHYGLQDSSIGFVGSSLSMGLSDAELTQKAWPLDELAERHDEFIRTFAGADCHSLDDTLFTYISMLHEWRRLAKQDPRLPDELNPNWIGSRTAILFSRLHTSWEDCAHRRWREIVSHEMRPSPV